MDCPNCKDANTIKIVLFKAKCEKCLNEFEWLGSPQLLNAAPELLDICKRWVEFIENGSGLFQYARDTDKAWLILKETRAAIKKATGITNEQKLKLAENKKEATLKTIRARE